MSDLSEDSYGKGQPSGYFGSQRGAVQQRSSRASGIQQHPGPTSKAGSLARGIAGRAKKKR